MDERSKAKAEGNGVSPTMNWDVCEEDSSDSGQESSPGWIYILEGSDIDMELLFMEMQDLQSNQSSSSWNIPTPTPPTLTPSHGAGVTEEERNFLLGLSWEPVGPYKRETNGWRWEFTVNPIKLTAHSSQNICEVTRCLILRKITSYVLRLCCAWPPATSTSNLPQYLQKLMSCSSFCVGKLRGSQPGSKRNTNLHVLVVSLL